MIDNNLMAHKRNLGSIQLNSMEPKANTVDRVNAPNMSKFGEMLCSKDHLRTTQSPCSEILLKKFKFKIEVSVLNNMTGISTVILYEVCGSPISILKAPVSATKTLTPNQTAKHKECPTRKRKEE